MMPDESTPDEQLMVALQRGDDSALNRLMARWQAPLRGFLLRSTQNEHDARDLAQETFVRVYQHRARFDPKRKFTTWLFAIALNLARNHARWRKRHPADSLEADETLHRSAPVPSPDAAGQSLAAEAVVAVKAAIAALPEDLRTAVLLFEYEEMSHAEIADAVGASPKAIETRLYRARQLLKKSLARYLA